jgi:hypothetical protein
MAALWAIDGLTFAENMARHNRITALPWSTAAATMWGPAQGGETATFVIN